MRHGEGGSVREGVCPGRNKWFLPANGPRAAVMRACRGQEEGRGLGGRAGQRLDAL